MRAFLATLMLVLIVCSFSLAQEEGTEVQLAEPFMTEYTGEDATGDQVIGLWQFDQPDPTADSSGNGHVLTLQDGQFVDDGRFGGALETFAGYPVVDDPHRAMTPNAPDLTPRGAFTMEMWISPSDQLNADYPSAFLLDKKYIDDNDYQLVLGGETAPAVRRLTMNLGFGNETVSWSSDSFSVEPGVWRHIAFVYDGNGTGSFFVDGSSAGSETKTGYGSITAGNRPLYIGDRVGSLYHGFPGRIDQVRICNEALEFRPAGFALVSDRRVFVRMEDAGPVRFAVTNRGREALEGASVSVTLNGSPLLSQDLPAIPSGESAEVSVPLDTSMRPDDYSIAATVEIGGDVPFTSTERFDITIVPRDTPNRMPVVMWGGAGSDELKDWLQRIGFTHLIGLSCNYQAIWDAGGPAPPTTPEGIASNRENLDDLLRRDMRVVSGLSPGRWARGQEEYGRINRAGEHYDREDVCGLFERIPQFVHDVGVSMAQAYGDHPGFQTALIHTEVRGDSHTCFHEHDHDAFKAFAGYDIPDEVKDIRGVHYEQIDGFPANRMIPDDYPPYVYYRWIWAEGDGWNNLHTQLHEGLKEGTGPDFWTFHDPAVRTAKAYGQGGDVDYLSQWTYSYPDPIRIGLATEELLQMTKGASRPDQQVMKMTQIIWYRSQTAPEPGEEATQQGATFEDQDVRPQGTRHR